MTAAPVFAAPQAHRARFAAASEPAAKVLRAIRLRGPVARDAVAQMTGLSTATVNRAVGALLRARVLKERPELVESGSIGRPRVPLDIDNRRHIALGVHIGLHVSTISAHDLTGRLIGGFRVPTGAAGAESSLRAISESTRRFLTRYPAQQVVGVGVALAGTVYEDGSSTHGLLGWEDVPVGELLWNELGVDVAVAPHVEAMAASELFTTLPDAAHDGFLFVYARESVGVASSHEGSVHTPGRGPATIARLPVAASALLDPHGHGRLEEVVGDSAVADAAALAGIPVADGGKPGNRITQVYKAAQEGNLTAVALLTERAKVLGRAIGLVADITSPDRIIIGGQAFTAAPEYLKHVSAEAHATHSGPRLRLHVTGAGDSVQQRAAAAVALDEALSNPLAVLE